MQLDSDNITLKELKESSYDLEEALASLIWEWEDKHDLILTDINIARDTESREVIGVKCPWFNQYERVQE